MPACTPSVIMDCRDEPGNDKGESARFLVNGLTVYSLLGGLVMLIVGLLIYGLLFRTLYPALRWRYERMKAYGRRGVEPHVWMELLKVVNLLALPAVGLLFGDPVLSVIW